MRMSRRMGLYGSNIPSFAELFATRVASINNGRNSATAGTISVELNRTSSPIPQAGSTWYAFYAVGPSLQIARIDVGSGPTFTEKWTEARSSTSDFYYFDVSGTKLVGRDSVYGGQLTAMRFNDTYPPAIIDYMLKNGLQYRPKSYYSTQGTASSTAASSSNTRVATANITDKAGVIFAMFYGTNYNFSVSRAATPTTLITGAAGGSISRTVIYERTYDGTSYLYPTEDGSSTVALRSYTLTRFAEKW